MVCLASCMAYLLYPSPPPAVVAQLSQPKSLYSISRMPSSATIFLRKVSLHALMASISAIIGTSAICQLILEASG